MCLCVCICVYVRSLTKTTKMYSQDRIAAEVWEHYGAFTNWSLQVYSYRHMSSQQEFLCFLFYVLISIIIFKKKKAYFGLPRRLERILFWRFSFHICIWIYDKAGTKVYCINCPELMRKEQTYYVNYGFIPREGSMMSQCSVWRKVSQLIWI